LEPWRHSEPMLEDKSVCIDDFFQYLGNRLSVDSNRAESDPLSKPDTGQNLQTLQSMQKTETERTHI